MNYRSTRACLGTMLVFAIGVLMGEPALSDVGRTSLEKRIGASRGLVLDKVGGTKALNGTYSDGRRTLRFETIRSVRARLAGQPSPDRDYYIALRVGDTAGRIFLLFGEGGNVPQQWRQEPSGREKPIEPEMTRLAQEAAQAIKELKLSKELELEQALLVQQLTSLSASPKSSGSK